MKRTYLLDRPLAAALGVGMDLRQRYGRMIVDMGAGITDIAVISEGEIVQSSSVYYAGDYFDDAIVRYIRKKYSLLIGERTAEQIKINIGTAMKPETDEANLAMPVVGRNQLSGLPRTQEIHAAEIYEALKDPVAALIGSIQDVLVRTPPQLASDIFDDGIVLSGGAAGLARLPEAIYTALHIPCGVADDPQTSVVLGCGIAVEDPAPTPPCSTTAARVSSACKPLYTESTPCFFRKRKGTGLFLIPCATKNAVGFPSKIK